MAQARVVACTARCSPEADPDPDHDPDSVCPSQIGDLIKSAMDRVGRAGVVTMEESRTAEDHLYVVEGMQFDRGYISPYFVTDPERMVRRFDVCFVFGFAVG